MRFMGGVLQAGGSLLRGDSRRVGKGQGGQEDRLGAHSFRARDNEGRDRQEHLCLKDAEVLRVLHGQERKDRKMIAEIGLMAACFYVSYRVGYKISEGKTWGEIGKDAAKCACSIAKSTASAANKAASFLRKRG